MKTDRAGHQPRLIFFPHAGLLLGLAAAGAVFLCYTTTLAPGLSWSNNGADGGDLITAAATLGIAHPSGYPTYLLLARAFQWLPIGTLAMRTNLMSAVCASLAAGLVTAIVSTAYSGPRRFGLAGGLVAGVAFGLSPLLWSQAVITEVHALHALCIAAILYTLPLGRQSPQPSGRSHFLAGALLGLALGNHLTTALLLPPWLILSGWENGKPQPARLAWRLAGLAAGLLVYAYLPLRAAAHPPINWGNPSTLEGMWWVISGGPYRALAFGLPQALVGARVQGWASLLIAQFGLVGMVAAFYGLFFGAAMATRVKLVTGWVAGVSSIFAIGYNTADSYAYLLPAFLALAIWLGLGLATALSGLRQKKWSFAAQAAVGGGLLLAILINGVSQLPNVDASRDPAAEKFGAAVMESAPPAALVFTHADRDTFAAWYFHFALGRRPDIAVVVEPLLVFDWYRDNLRATYPALNVPGQTAASWRDTLLQSNARPACDARLDAAAALACGGASP
jgi:MFS family permease